jgi:CoA:oxalate CoA-transferase
MRQAVEHPQIEPRQLLVRQTHPQFGEVTTLGPVVKLSRTPADIRLPPPALGEHTTAVLRQLSTFNFQVSSSTPQRDVES